MPIPSVDSCMLPLLRAIEDKKVHRFRDIVDHLAKHFLVTPEELRQMIPSRRAFVFYNRVAWAKTNLTKAKLLELPSRGHLQITNRGIEVLKSKPEEINNRYLQRYPEFLEPRKSSKEDVNTYEDQDSIIENTKPMQYLKGQAPDEILGEAYTIIRKALVSELLNQIMKNSEFFFEQLVIDLILAMGYGGSKEDAGELTSITGDGGIDGIIKQDRLGLDLIYLQAKRWDLESTVSRPEIQKFAGALQGRHATKGIFITTSNFSKQAIEFAKSISNKVILIDGEQLANLMIDCNVGVSLKESYQVKKLDLDYFTEDD